MNIIKICEFVDNGLSEKNGLKIREKILETLTKNNEVILDFSNITLFATPFFNSFIGYFVLQINPENTKEKIKIINISDLGRDTYNHSYENAVYIRNKKLKEKEKKEIGKITSNNINEG